MTPCSHFRTNFTIILCKNGEQDSSNFFGDQIPFLKSCSKMNFSRFQRFFFNTCQNFGQFFGQIIECQNVVIFLKSSLSRFPGTRKTDKIGGNQKLICCFADDICDLPLQSTLQQVQIAFYVKHLFVDVTKESFFTFYDLGQRTSIDRSGNQKVSYISPSHPHDVLAI